MSRILVTGATGFIGRRLVPALIEKGHEVRAMTRRPEAYDGPGDPVGADVNDADSLTAPLEGVDVAYYLVHSLDDADFERKDAEAARAFAKAAADQGVRQIIYMGGLGDDGELSAHLRSRRQVEGLLGETGVPVTVLRAAIVVGAGGISWEITRQLVKNLPAMVVPKWATTMTQPIALDDVIRYLVGVLGEDAALGQTYEIGGPDRLTYVDMLRLAAAEGRGRKVADPRGAGAHAQAVVVLAGAGHRRRRHHRPQPDRLDGHRGGRPRAADPGGRPRRADRVRRGGAPRAAGAARLLTDQVRMAGSA